MIFSRDFLITRASASAEQNYSRSLVIKRMPPPWPTGTSGLQHLPKILPEPGMNKVICSCFGMLFLLLAAACAKLPVQDCCSKTQGPLKELALNESDTIKVCAVEPLNPSGILVKKGYSY